MSDKAIRLFAVLGNYANSDNAATPGRKELARRLGKPGHPVSVDTVDRAKAELVEVKAIVIEPQFDDKGDRTSNRYTLLYAAPTRRGGRTDSMTPGRTDAAGTRLESELGKSSSSSKSWPPKTIDDLRLTEKERRLAENTLSTFNDTFGKNFRGAEHLKKIVQRHREHPEADLDALIEKASGNRWWERRHGRDFSPHVIFGNATIFERTLNFDPNARGGGPDLSRYR